MGCWTYMAQLLAAMTPMMTASCYFWAGSMRGSSRKWNTQVVIDRPFPPTHSMTGTYDRAARRTRLWLACTHMWNDPRKHFWGLWRFSVNSVGPVRCDCCCPNMMEMGLRLFLKSGIKVAFDPEEGLWNFVERVESSVNESTGKSALKRYRKMHVWN